MTDLINRFRKQKHSSPPSPPRHTSPDRPPTLTSLSAPTTTSGGSACWNIDQLQSSMRKSEKKQVSADVLSQQLHIFQDKQREMLAKKIVVIAAITIPLAWLTKMEGNTIFCLAILVIAHLLPNQAMNISRASVISNSLKFIQPLLYNVQFYYLLKYNAADHDINWVYALLSLLATCLHCAMRLYRPAFLLTGAQTMALAMGESSIVRKWSYFGRYMCQKGFFLAALAKNLLAVLLVSGVILGGLFKSANCFQWQILRPFHLINTVKLLLLLEFYLETVNFVNENTANPLQITREKSPVFLNLLRLNSKPECWPIHRQCLRSLYMHTHNTPFYLSTETWKSLTYKTYMDIFNQYAQIELERIHGLVTETIVQLRVYQKMVNSSKTPLEDLFIHYRKAKSYLLAEEKSAQMLALLADSRFLLIIAVEVEHQAAQGKEFIRVSQKVRDLINALHTQLIQASQLSVLSQFTRAEMMINGLRLSSGVFEMENEQL